MPVQITLNIPDNAVPRLRAAMLDRFPQTPDPVTGEVPAPPTDQELVAEFKDILRQRAVELIREYELRKAAEQADADNPEPEIT